MRPGDLPYLPRGQYHDAVATSDGTIHVAFGVTHVIGMDAIDLFSGMAVSDPLFRRNMPRRSETDTEAGEWLAALGDRIAAYARSPEAISAMAKHQREFRYPRAGFDLPVTPASHLYRVTAKNLVVEQRNGRWVLTGPKGTAPIPSGYQDPVSWIVSQTAFCRDDLIGAFPDVAGTDLDSLLKDLGGMRVVACGA
jgi:hypothetical protein